MIQNIKETTAGNYSEDEIIAMLHECNMDPDETAQRLLLQDPFHEVKKKRDKRKEVWGFCSSFGLFMGFCVKDVY
jgi:hypothetical protein